MAKYKWTQMEERLTTLNLYPNPVIAQTTEERPLDCFACSNKLSGARIILNVKLFRIFLL